MHEPIQDPNPSPALQNHYAIWCGDKNIWNVIADSMSVNDNGQTILCCRPQDKIIAVIPATHMVIVTQHMPLTDTEKDELREKYKKQFDLK